MIPRWHVLVAIFRREFAAYFTNPSGYVFISAFVLVGAVMAFCPPPAGTAAGGGDLGGLLSFTDEFFVVNRATLDLLNRMMPLLLIFFIPAVTMGLWAEERKQGTDELLLTLPATDFEIVMGKYLAALGIYLAALGFSLTFLIPLFALGRPDPGLLAANYLGYVVLGACLIAGSMVGSLISGNVTVAFLLGALFCAATVFSETAVGMVARFLERAFPEAAFRIAPERYFPLAPFRELSEGVLSFQAVVLVVATAAAGISLSLLILGQRRRGAGLAVRLVLPALQAVALVVAVVSATALGGRVAWRADLTADRIASLSETTLEVLRELDPPRPVLIRAFVGPSVPRSYEPQRRELLRLLREYEARAGGGLIVDVIPTPRWSEAEREAEAYGIKPQEVTTQETGVLERHAVTMGLVFACGAEEALLPFVYPGLPLEYELTRSIRVVSRTDRRRIGVLNTEVRVFGGFDFTTFRTREAWQVVQELRQQYGIVEVAADKGYPDDMDVLVAVMPSSLPQDQMDRLFEHIRAGKPTLIVDDPMPLFQPNLAAAERMVQRGSPFMGGSSPTIKGDIAAALRSIGVEWDVEQVVWDSYNPLPRYGEAIWPEYVFVSPASGSSQAFHPQDPATAGLQTVLLLAPGFFGPAEGSDVTFVPLLRSSSDSGLIRQTQIFSRTFLGWELNRDRRHTRTQRAYVLAARLEGQNIRAIVVADADVISDAFFELRRMGQEDLQFDNVSFILNAIDSLVGDVSLVELRRRQVRPRTLERIEEAVRRFQRERDHEIQEAEDAAKARLDEAQRRLDEAVREVRQRTDLDELAKEIMIEQRQRAEQRKLDVQRRVIEDQKRRRIEESRRQMEERVDRLEWWIKLAAVAVPPVPAFLLAAVVFLLRRIREARGGPP